MSSLRSYLSRCLSAAARRHRPDFISPPPPRLNPPPPLLELMLDVPRLLLLRALAPSNPREPPPNASRLPPPLRDRSLLPIRSLPPPTPEPPARLLTPAPLLPKLFPKPLAASATTASEIAALTSDLLPGALCRFDSESPRAYLRTDPPCPGPDTERRRGVRDYATSYPGPRRPGPVESRLGCRRQCSYCRCRCCSLPRLILVLRLKLLL